MEEGRETLSNCNLITTEACKGIGLAVNTRKTKYVEVARHRGKIENEHIRIGSNSYEKVRTFKY